MATHQAKQYGTSRPEYRRRELTERVETIDAVERTEVRHDAVERLAIGERFQKHGEILQPAWHHLRLCARAFAGKPTQGPPHHRLRRVACDNTNALGCEKCRIETSAAPDLENP